jgi:tRNA-specific 2-thiouridylase
MRVLAAMSGGVDSAVAAALAVQAGHDVTGVHMALSRTPGTLRTGSRGCCTVEDAFDARRVCDLLGIPYYVWDFSDDFIEDVVTDFLAEYSAGRTPNPCLRCNEKIKFAALLDRAIALGFDAVATGHYARMLDGTLHRGVDVAKDQSYVLAVLTPEQLAHSMFPLGWLTKPQVREIARDRGFAVAGKPDSYDICFIPDGNTHGYLLEKLGARPGAVVDATTGVQLAEHDGAFAFTIGQRKGLRLDRPAPDGRPRYVLGIEPVSGTVTVGPATGLDVEMIVAGRVVYPAGRRPDFPVRVQAQLRAHGGTVGGSADLVDGELRLSLDGPTRGVAPGQTVVLYGGVGLDAPSGDPHADQYVMAAGTIVRTG